MFRRNYCNAQGIVQTLAWNPNPALHMLVIGSDKRCVMSFVVSPFVCVCVSVCLRFASPLSSVSNAVILLMLNDFMPGRPRFGVWVYRRLLIVSTGTGGPSHTAATAEVLKGSAARKCTQSFYVHYYHILHALPPSLATCSFFALLTCSLWLSTEESRRRH